MTPGCSAAKSFAACCHIATGVGIGLDVQHADRRLRLRQADAERERGAEAEKPRADALPCERIVIVFLPV